LTVANLGKKELAAKVSEREDQKVLDVVLEIFQETIKNPGKSRAGALLKKSLVQNETDFKKADKAIQKSTQVKR
jgi:hypothetical protein